jgi:hypothetical protein
MENGMHRHKRQHLPENVEYAIGCGDEAAVVRYFAVYRDVNGEGIWYSGVNQGYLPPGLFSLLEQLWGVLVKGYGYVLDIEAREVRQYWMLMLEEDFLVQQRESPRPWLQEERTVQTVVEQLVAYAEDPIGAEADGCRECYFGYEWQQGLYAFVPCAWCDGAG